VKQIINISIFYLVLGRTRGNALQTVTRFALEQLAILLDEQLGYRIRANIIFLIHPSPYPRNCIVGL
jgi:hypothetical protein